MFECLESFADLDDSDCDDCECDDCECDDCDCDCDSSPCGAVCGAAGSGHLVLLQSALLDHLVPLLLEGDDDEGHEDVDEEEGEDHEVDHVEDGHLHAVAAARAHVLLRHVRGVLEDSGGGER